jgi:hypothetical protein
MKPRLLVAAVGGAIALGFGLVPTLAGAQEGGATISVEQSHPASDSVHYIVQVTEGGQPVEGATVTATATGEDGTAGQPVTLSAGTDGQYQGTVELGEEGTWTIRFESTDPAGSLDYTQEMPAESTSSGDDGGGGSAVVLILVIVFLAVVAGIAGWIWFTRQREREDDPVGPSNEPL